MTATTKTRTITLTDAPPVRIREKDWPVIAAGDYVGWDNNRYQANRTWECNIRVRQNADSRAIVSGVYHYDTSFPNERGFAAKAGVLIAAKDDIVSAIKSVGDTLAKTASEAGHDFNAHISESVRECIADLPAQEI